MFIINFLALPDPWLHNIILMGAAVGVYALIWAGVFYALYKTMEN
jgi:hypothetical protein